MKLIEVAKIHITPDRQRKEFEPMAMQELSNAIQARGLMHPIVLRQGPEGMTLVAGERRLRAIANVWMLGGCLKFDGEIIPEGFVPYTSLGDLDPLQAEEAELEENMHREDLTWQEQATAMAKLHSLRTRQAQAEGRLHTVADTAMEVKGRSDGHYQASVRKDLIVSKYLSNPEIAKAKNVDEAFKILKKQEAVQKNVQLAAEVGKTYSAAVHELHNADCLSWMATCERERFDVILTDPPYGMGADTFGDGGGGRLANNEHHYKDDKDSWLKLMSEWCPLSFRVAKPEAHAYVFCDIDNFPELRNMMKAAGWYVFRTPFISNKPNSGRVPLPDEGPRRQWEMILYAIKGHKKTTAIYPDVITTMADANMTHGAQKPVALFSNLLQRSVHPGDEVLDCFAGSGTILPAAQQFQCKAVAIEANPEYYAMCVQRLRDIENPSVTSGDALTDELQQLMQK